MIQSGEVQRNQGMLDLSPFQLYFQFSGLPYYFYYWASLSLPASLNQGLPHRGHINSEPVFLSLDLRRQQLSLNKRHLLYRYSFH